MSARRRSCVSRKLISLCRVAGNDTVSITLTAILYHLAANPSSLARLHHELDQATSDGTLSSTVTYKEAASLPYLAAVINEGFRIHPLFGYPVPRVVPEGGAEVCGRWWPAGTVLGTSCGVPEKNREVFGDDADSWRPERWLVDKEKAARMWDDVCAFGTGQRACIGQHVSPLSYPAPYLTVHTRRRRVIISRRNKVRMVANLLCVDCKVRDHQDNPSISARIQHCDR